MRILVTSKMCYLLTEFSKILQFGAFLLLFARKHNIQGVGTAALTLFTSSLLREFYSDSVNWNLFTRTLGLSSKQVSYTENLTSLTPKVFVESFMTFFISK